MVIAIAVAFTASGSNMGFKKGFNFPPTGGENLNWISLPYFYGSTDAEGLCRDLGGASRVARVVRWDEASSSYVSYTCGGKTPFPLEKGIAYGVVNAPDQTINAAIVGSHDNSFVFNIPPTAGSNLTWVSIPYHHNIPNHPGTPAGIDAEDLCRDIGSTKVQAIVRWDEPTSSYVSYTCGSGSPFPITVGTGYGIINAPGQTIMWRPPHF